MGPQSKGWKKPGGEYVLLSDQDRCKVRLVVLWLFERATMLIHFVDMPGTCNSNVGIDGNTDAVRTKDT